MSTFFFKTRHVHIAFRKLISDHKHFEKILEFISDEWEKVYELAYPRLITSLKWHLDYLFFKKEKVKNGSCAGQTL